jgi:hypothetical protein
MFFNFPDRWDNYPGLPAERLEDNIKIIMKAIEQISTQEEVSTIPEGIRELINCKVRFTDFLHQTMKDTTECASKPKKLFAEANIFLLIKELNKNIEKLEVKIGDELVDKYEMARIGNYEIYQKILEQISSIKMGSAENLRADFYKRINTDFIYLKQEILENRNAINEIHESVKTIPQYKLFENFNTNANNNLQNATKNLRTSLHKKQPLSPI